MASPTPTWRPSSASRERSRLAPARARCTRPPAPPTSSLPSPAEMAAEMPEDLDEIYTEGVVNVSRWQTVVQTLSEQIQRKEK